MHAGVEHRNHRTQNQNDGCSLDEPARFAVRILKVRSLFREHFPMNGELEAPGMLPSHASQPQNYTATSTIHKLRQQTFHTENRKLRKLRRESRIPRQSSLLPYNAWPAAGLLAISEFPPRTFLPVQEPLPCIAFTTDRRRTARVLRSHLHGPNLGPLCPVRGLPTGPGRFRVATCSRSPVACVRCRHRIQLAKPTDHLRSDGHTRVGRRRRALARAASPAKVPPAAGAQAPPLRERSIVTSVAADPAIGRG